MLNIPTMEEFKAQAEEKRQAEVEKQYEKLMHKFAKSLGFEFRIESLDDPDSNTIVWFWHYQKSWWGEELDDGQAIAYRPDRDKAYVLEHIPEELVEMWFKRNG